MTDRQTDRFLALDAFRGLFAMFVCVHHMAVLNSFSEGNFFRGSYIFVEFFFVLSGFVMAHSYGFREKLKFKPFFFARFFRLYPLHIAMFGLVFLLTAIKFVGYKYFGFSGNSIPFTGASAISEIIPNLLLIQSWSHFTCHLSFNYPSWSISIEFYMYIIFFLTVIVFNKFKSVVWGVISLLVICLIGSSSILTEEVLRGLSCFFGGATVYLLYKRLKEIKINYYIGSAIELLLIFATPLIVSSSNILEQYRVLVIVFFLFVVLFFAFESGCISSILKKHLFQMLGKLSYSIYMTHAFLLMCFMILALLSSRLGYNIISIHNDKQYIGTGSFVIDSLISIMMICSVILFSHLTYKYIELKGQQIGKKIIGKK